MISKYKYYIYAYLFCASITLFAMAIANPKFAIAMSLFSSIEFIVLFWIFRRMRMTPVEMRAAIRRGEWKKFFRAPVRPMFYPMAIRAFMSGALPIYRDPTHGLVQPSDLLLIAIPFASLAGAALLVLKPSEIKSICSRQSEVRPASRTP